MIFRRKKKRILVADDDEDFRSAMRAVLEFAGYKVQTAGDGKEALKEIKSHKYDLLVLDVVMPEIDGVKLFQMARRSRRYKDIPVVFVSAHQALNEMDERKREIVKEAGAYIRKPFQTKTFLETVRKLSGERPNPKPSSSISKAT